MESTYRIEEENTSGWDLLASDTVNLTKQEALKRIEEYISQGNNPNRLRITREIVEQTTEE